MMEEYREREGEGGEERKRLREEEGGRKRGLQIEKGGQKNNEEKGETFGRVNARWRE